MTHWAAPFHLIPAPWLQEHHPHWDWDLIWNKAGGSLGLNICLRVKAFLFFTSRVICPFNSSAHDMVLGLPLGFLTCFSRVLRDVWPASCLSRNRVALQPLTALPSSPMSIFFSGFCFSFLPGLPQTPLSHGFLVVNLI